MDSEPPLKKIKGENGSAPSPANTDPMDDVRISC